MAWHMVYIDPCILRPHPASKATSVLILTAPSNNWHGRLSAHHSTAFVLTLCKPYWDFSMAIVEFWS